MYIDLPASIVDRWLGMLLIYTSLQERDITGRQGGSQRSEPSSSMAEKLHRPARTILMDSYVRGPLTRTVNLARVPLFGARKAFPFDTGYHLRGSISMWEKLGLNST